MRKDYLFIKVPIIFILYFLLCSCNRVNVKEVEYDKPVYSPSYSSNFKIKGKDNSENSIIEIYNPWQGSKEVETSLLILRDGDTPKNYRGQILRGEAKRIICMSSTHIAMLDALNASDRIVGVSGLQYVTNGYIQGNKEKIPDIGYEGNIDYEKLVATKPDIVLLFSVNGSSAMEPKLQELGIPFVYIGDYVEEDPLGKTEWIIPIAELIGEREKGKKLFDEVTAQYENLRNEIKSEQLDRPKVMVNAPFLDSWFMPSTKSYVARMIADAGGEYIYKKNTGNSSMPIDMEEALYLVSEADYWINIGTINSKEELIDACPQLAGTKPMTEGKLYNNNFRSTIGGGNDCYESGVVNPHVMLRDMIKVFHPEKVKEPFIYYHRLQ